MKRFLAVLALLTVALACAFAEIPLLARSILSSSTEELRAMSRAFGLDDQVPEDQLVENLLEYFSIDLDEQPEEDEEAKAQKATSIMIDNADSLFSSGDTIIMSGNVRISFTTESDSSARTLISDTVAINLKEKVLDASGSVSLDGTKDQKRTFSGEVISLD